jgi:hypothetical protein
MRDHPRTHYGSRPGQPSAFSRLADARRMVARMETIAAAHEAAGNHDRANAVRAAREVVQGVERRLFESVCSTYDRVARQRPTSAKPEKARDTTQVVQAPDRDQPRARARKPTSGRRRRPSAAGDDSEPAPPAGLTFLDATPHSLRVLKVGYQFDGERISVYSSDSGFVLDCAYDGPRAEAPIELWDAIAVDLPDRLTKRRRAA